MLNANRIFGVCVRVATYKYKRAKAITCYVDVYKNAWRGIRDMHYSSVVVA